MIVYGSALSPFVRKVRVVIAEKGLTAAYKPVFPQADDAEFKAASPLGKIPALQDGEFKLADSSAIVHYLEKKHPTPAILPAKTEDYGRAIWFDEFSDTSLVASAGKVFFNIVVKKMMGAEPDLAAVETALRDELPPLYRYLETQIKGPYLVGDALSLADIAVASPFVNLKIAGHPVDAAAWPVLTGYLAPILERPSFVGAKD
jgi:glutathione S-transferase